MAVKNRIEKGARTMQNQVTVDEWVSMFREIGLDDRTMMKWHHLFESRHPAGHQSFLEWLGLTAEKIGEIRTKSR
jgi:hypothetical protein